MFGQKELLRVELEETRDERNAERWSNETNDKTLISKKN